jgi:hypothetical protein
MLLRSIGSVVTLAAIVEYSRVGKVVRGVGWVFTNGFVVVVG